MFAVGSKQGSPQVSAYPLKPAGMVPAFTGFDCAQFWLQNVTSLPTVSVVAWSRKPWKTSPVSVIGPLPMTNVPRVNGPATSAGMLSVALS